VVVLAHATIGADVAVGRDGTIHSGVRIADRVELGERVIVHANAVIGSDGFSFLSNGGENGSVAAANPQRIHSLGTVIVGDDVEIGAGTTIDRATIASTRIGKGTKIDNQVQIGHNVTIGSACILCAQVGIAGSATIGDRVVLGGKSGIADHVKIGSDVLVAAASAVGGDVASRSIVMGVPAQKRDEALKLLVALRRLPSTTETVARIRKSLKLPKS
jgi:UDP-3-O-[3-hydroxymyristoyl] glucosamine N-acyltransferase